MDSKKVLRAMEVLSVAGVRDPQLRRHLAQALANAGLLATDRLQAALTCAEQLEQRLAAVRYAFNRWSGGPDDEFEKTMRGLLDPSEVSS